ncbi:tetratricopeptide repeat protein [Candidatus Methanocrinis natronophilus]|uniref:Tetratricopeptide repeat protein n=1 Tax=Candidatus Methanocrinis natronophilus TaxID=3033396 RepID=A0ABT5X7C9_9EURY|nr:tetratricopeptide repeat protein [Candidatus Methanocrinis natronophilus]MDF0590563.1 tetratricopeptide repeat protein [Candidatus Methanocrinis natronophilus]
MTSLDIKILRLSSSLHLLSPSIGPSEDPRRLIEEGNSSLKEGDLDHALNSYQRAARVRPSSSAERRSALVLGMMGRYMEAIASLDLAAEMEPLDPMPWIFRGFIFWRLERWQEATASFERAVALRPEEEYARYCRSISVEEINKRRARRF